MQELKIHFLNTIWSDAIILESRNHFSMIDTGSDFYYPMISKHLKDNQIKELEFILLTHFHDDHYGNLQKIINNFKVKTLYLKRYYGLDGRIIGRYKTNEEYIQNDFDHYHLILEACLNNNTEVIFIDDFGMDQMDLIFDNHLIELYDCQNMLYELYQNHNSSYYNQRLFSENFNSIGIFIKVNNFNIFLGADVTCSNTNIVELRELSLKMLDKIYQRHNIDYIDIYKSCHHGGGGTNTLPLCEKLKAKYVVITNTARWLDTYDTYSNLKIGNKHVEILPTDYQKYIFTINHEITYEKLIEDSLFITLKKD